MEEVLRCPKCGSSQTRLRIRLEERICYTCGNVWKVNKEEDDNGRIPTGI